MDKIYDVMPFISKNFILRSSRVANFVDIIKNITTFFEKVIESKLCIKL